MTTHTPGPWTASWSTNEGHNLRTAKGWLILATCGGYETLLASISDETNERAANAALMAAAPDLLVALIDAECAIMSEVNQSDGEDHPVIQAHAEVAARARMAIAKARGKPK